MKSTHDTMPDNEKEDLRRWLQERFDLRYLEQAIFEAFKKDRFGRIELIAYGFCGLVLMAFATLILNFFMHVKV